MLNVNFRLRFLLLMAVAATAACTSSGVADSRGFSTEQQLSISEDLSKRFEIHLVREEGTAFFDATGGRFDTKKFRKFVDKRVDDLILSIGYCRDGYFVYDRSGHPDKAYVRGECRDSASELDVARWGAPAL